MGDGIVDFGHWDYRVLMGVVLALGKHLGILVGLGKGGGLRSVPGGGREWLGGWTGGWLWLLGGFSGSSFIEASVRLRNHNTTDDGNVEFRSFKQNSTFKAWKINVK